VEAYVKEQPKIEVKNQFYKHLKELKMKKLFAALLFVLAPTVSLAGGHSGLGGHGTGMTMNVETMQGTSGTLVMQTTQDVWMWETPPEGFPAATTATCNQFIALGTTPQPIGGAVVCRAVDPDGDIFMNTGVFQADGTVKFTNVAATGKWAAYIGASWIGKTETQIGDKASVYSFTPTN